MPAGVFFGHASVERRVGELQLSIRQADPTRVIERHTHDDAHFVLVIDGAYVSTAHNAITTGNGPLLIYNPPGTTHQDHFADRQGVFTGRFFTLSVPVTMAVDDASAQPIAGTARALHHPSAVMIAQQLVRECRRWDHLSPLAIETMGRELLHHAMPTTRALERRAPAWLYRSVERLHDGAGDRVTIADLAREASVHPVYLARCVRRWFGVGVADLLRSLRLRAAVAHCVDSGGTIADAAHAAGFADEAHFNRTLRAATGYSPGRYRALVNTFSHA